MESKLHSRKETRLRGYDYAQPGSYFVTVCAHNKKCLFASIRNGKHSLLPLGKLLGDTLRTCIETTAGYKLTDCVIMPNHIHILVSTICGRQDVAGASSSTGGPSSGSVSSFVQKYKSMVTRIARAHGLIAESDVIWQRGFHDHVIRNEEDELRVREYIQNNPLQWHIDKENPDYIDPERAKHGFAPTN